MQPSVIAAGHGDEEAEQARWTHHDGACDPRAHLRPFNMTISSLLSYVMLRRTARTWVNALNDYHRLTAVRANDLLGIMWLIFVLCVRLIRCGRCLAKQTFGLGQSFPIARCQQAVVAHLDKASGQYMLEKAMDEGLGRESAGTLPFGGAVLIAEGDLAILCHENAFVAQGLMEDKGRKT